MDQSGMEIPVTLIIKAPNQKYRDQTISCFLNWTVGKLKTHLSNVYPSKPVSVDKLTQRLGPRPFATLRGVLTISVLTPPLSGQTDLFW